MVTAMAARAHIPSSGFLPASFLKVVIRFSISSLVLIVSNSEHRGLANRQAVP